MIKITLEVEGMRCGMCETHVNDVVRRVEGVKKVASSHAKGRTEVIAEDGVDITRIKAAIAAQGYTVGIIQSQPYEKTYRLKFRRAAERYFSVKTAAERRHSCAL